MADIKLLLENTKTFHVYRVLNVQHDYSKDKKVSNYTLTRLGDHKISNYTLEALERTFVELNDDEVELCLEYIKNSPLNVVAPLRYYKGLLKWGKAEDNYQNKPLFTEQERKEMAQFNADMGGKDSEILKALEEVSLTPPPPSELRKDGFTPGMYKDDILKELSRKEDSPKISKKTSSHKESLEVGSLIKTTGKDDFNHVFLAEATKSTIKAGILKLKLRTFLDTQWNLGSVEPQQSKNVMNFYGPPGTGKTLSAKAVAHALKKKLLHVDYAQVESKYVGETAKNIQKIFDLAKQYDAVILFDEADTLVSKRGRSGDEQNATHVNQTRNVFMQELDMFDGVVILTTNLFENYDAALLRRINQHVGFELPSVEIREKLIRSHIPKEVPLVDVNFEKLAQLSQGLSGGDIKNFTYEAMVACASQAEESNLDLKLAALTQQHLEIEIKKIKDAKQVHEGATKVISMTQLSNG